MEFPASGFHLDCRKTIAESVAVGKPPPMQQPPSQRPIPPGYGSLEKNENPNFTKKVGKIIDNSPLERFDDTDEIKTTYPQLRLTCIGTRSSQHSRRRSGRVQSATARDLS